LRESDFSEQSYLWLDTEAIFTTKNHYRYKKLLFLTALLKAVT